MIIRKFIFSLFAILLYIYVNNQVHDLRPSYFIVSALYFFMLIWIFTIKEKSMFIFAIFLFLGIINFLGSFANWYWGYILSLVFMFSAWITLRTIRAFKE